MWLILCAKHCLCEVDGVIVVVVAIDHPMVTAYHGGRCGLRLQEGLADYTLRFWPSVVSPKAKLRPGPCQVIQRLHFMYTNIHLLLYAELKTQPFHKLH